MKLEKVHAIMLLAGIEVLSTHEIKNKYWGSVDAYKKISDENPWWLVKTHVGLIEIGWRKRVISINWSDTPIREILTKDEVTKGNDHVHAWSYGEAIIYLSQFQEFITDQIRKNHLISKISP